MSSADIHQPSSDKLRPHSFDGIQEFDNQLPKWWLWTLYLTCIFAAGYWVHYVVLGSGPSSYEEYTAEVRAADELVAARLGPISNETLQEFAKLESKVAAGRAVFVEHCVICHTANGGGSIGPNLTDAYWLHGGKPMDMLKVIEDGVIAKGMASWKGILGRGKITEVIAYLLTIKNTNVTGGKEPQGTLEKVD